MILSNSLFYLIFLITNSIFLLIFIATYFLNYKNKVVNSYIHANFFIFLYSNSILFYFTPNINHELRLIIIKVAFITAILSAIGIGYFTKHIINRMSRINSGIFYFFIGAWGILILLSASDLIVTDFSILPNGIIKTSYGSFRPLYLVIFILYGIFLSKLFWEAQKLPKHDEEHALLLSMQLIISLTWILICATNLILPTILNNSLSSISAPFLLLLMNINILATLYYRKTVTEVFRSIFMPSQESLISFAVHQKNRDIVEILQCLEK